MEYGEWRYLSMHSVILWSSSGVFHRDRGKENCLYLLYFSIRGSYFNTSSLLLCRDIHLIHSRHQDLKIKLWVWIFWYSNFNFIGFSPIVLAKRDRSHSVTCQKAREPGFLPLKDIPPSMVSGSCTVNVSPCAISKQVICDFSLFPWQLHKREHYRLAGPKIVVMISLRNWMHFSTIKF